MRYKFSLSCFIYLPIPKMAMLKSIATMKNYQRQFLRFYNLHLKVGLTSIIIISNHEK